MATEHLAQLLEDTSIDCGPLGDELERRVAEGLATWTGMARQLGWERYKYTNISTRYQAGDGSRLKVAVGKAPYKRRDGELRHQTRITIKLAEFICLGLDVDMIEVGL